MAGTRKRYVVGTILAVLTVGAIAGAIAGAREPDRAASPTTERPATTAPETTERQAAPATATTTATTAARPGGEGRLAVVGSITDGDTFRTTDGERIRLIGIDTPEVAGDACFAAEATDALAAMIPPGAEVQLVVDVEATDRYGRTLAYVHRASDDLFVNRELAVQGFALQLTIPPNVARAVELGAAVADARTAGRGLWGGCPTGTTATTPPTVTTPPPPPPPAVSPPPAAGCDPSYPDVCIPPAPPDLDCGQIPHRRFAVVGADPHGFDGDHDGVGCES